MSWLSVWMTLLTLATSVVLKLLTRVAVLGDAHVIVEKPVTSTFEELDEHHNYVFPLVTPCESWLCFKNQVGPPRMYRSHQGQDQWVIERVLPGKRGGWFIDSGAGPDGIRGSNSYVLETEFGWRGLLVEPAAPLRAELRGRGLCPQAIAKGSRPWRYPVGASA